MEKGRIMMIIIIVLLVVLLGTVAAVSVYVLSLINNQNLADDNSAGGGNTIKVLSVEEKTTVALGDAITTNLLPGVDGEAHIAQILVSLSYDNTAGKETEAFAALLTANLTIARSVALDVISDCTFDDLSGPDGKDYLADIIKSRLQEEFNTMLIVDIVFDQWLIP